MLHCYIQNKCYELPNLKNWMHKLCTSYSYKYRETLEGGSIGTLGDLMNYHKFAKV